MCILNKLKLKKRFLLNVKKMFYILERDLCTLVLVSRRKQYIGRAIYLKPWVINHFFKTSKNSNFNRYKLNTQLFFSPHIN